MAKRPTQLERAIADLEAQKAVLQHAIDTLREQQTKATTSRPKADPQTPLQTR